jgi:hypothetical protein
VRLVEHINVKNYDVKSRRIAGSTEKIAHLGTENSVDKILLGVFKSRHGGTLHPVTPAPIKALSYLCLFPPIAEKSKPPALRVVGDSFVAALMIPFSDSDLAWQLLYLCGRLYKAFILKVVKC